MNACSYLIDFLDIQIIAVIKMKKHMKKCSNQNSENDMMFVENHMFCFVRGILEKLGRM